MRGRIWRFAFLLSAAALVFARPLPGQTISGIIAGKVTDVQQKALSSVAITAHNPGTGRDFPASTDEQGYFRILEVPPGLYEVTAVLGGFETVKHVNVRVDVNRTTVEDFSLKIQTREESVTVESTAPLAVMDSPTLSSASPERPITELPVITRDVNNLALLAPGVLSVRTFSFASTLVPFSVNGSRGRDNNFIIDSVDNNEPLFGGAATQFTNAEIFQEYSISTGQLKAEFGRNSGATVNAITKSGSNNWHGTLFGYGQSDKFDATNRVEQQALLTSPEPFYDTTVGATLGGPIRKEKSFFFLSYQWDRLSDNLSDVFPVLSNYPASPADLAVLQGLATSPGLQALLATPSFSRVPAALGTNCFAHNPPAPTMGAQLYSHPNPCLLTSTGVPVSGALFGETPQTANFNVWNVPNANTFNLRDHQLSGRYDQRINNSNDFYSRYLFDDLASPRFPLESSGVGAFSDIGLLPDWKTFLRQRTQSFLADHRYYRVNSLNEFRMSYTRVSQGQGPFDAPADTLNRPSAIIADSFATPATIGGLGGQGSIGSTSTPPGVFPSAGNLLTLGSDSSPSHISSNTYQIQDNYSYTYGRHSMKFGVNFVKIDTNSLGVPDDNGFYIYNGFNLAPPCTAAGCLVNGLQSFLDEGLCLNPATGAPVTCAGVVSQRLVDVRTNALGAVIGQGPNEIKIKEFDQFYFAQDDWRARNNLTLSFGIRYENFGQPINSVHDINPSAPFVNTDNKDFAPRLGFAWSPSQHWVVRGGYGIQYDPPILDIPLLIWQSGPVSPLITTDTFNVAQLQSASVYPNAPLTIADLQKTVSKPAFVAGVPTMVNVSSGMVQGCSQYLDLFNSLAGIIPAPSRAFNQFAANPATGTTLPANIPIVNCSAQDTVSKNLKNPYVQLWSLGVQRELGANYMVEVNYVGSKGTRLFQRMELNPFQGWDSTCVSQLAPTFQISGAGNLAVPGQCRFNRIDDSHGDITEVTNGGSSTYHALQASLTKRLSRSKYFGDFSFTMAYTWSHLIDNTSEIFGPGFRTLRPGDIQPLTTATAFPPVGLLFDPLANAPVEAITPLAQTFNSTTDTERGNSSFDRRHRFVFSSLWEPFPTRNVWLRGWLLNSIFTYQSGQPFSPLNASPLSACNDANGDGSSSNDRPMIGNPKAPLSSVALINSATDPLCLPPGVPGAPAALDYVDLNGNPISPANAHFVQRPLFASPTIPGLTLTSATPAGYAGNAGRNILFGPRTVNLDMSLYRNIKLNERFTMQLRAEAYDILNHPVPGYFNGNPYISDASGAPAFAYAATRTGAAVTGGIPENAIDAVDQVSGKHTFLSQNTMNTSSRRLQFGIRLMF
jgi:hypothetical protein